jgi:hypothetical protein
MGGARGIYTEMPVDGETSLKEAKDWLRPLTDPEGAICPCCTQLARVYHWQIYGTHVKAMAEIWKAKGVNKWCHAPTVLKHRHVAFQRLAYWGLMEEEQDIKRDDGGRAGWWRVTMLGENWIYGNVSVPKFARVYSGRLLGLHGTRVKIHQCVSKKFDLNELLGFEYYQREI